MARRRKLNLEIVWSQAADRDLSRVYGYLEEQSRQGARRVLREIFTAVDTLAELPLLGKAEELNLDREYRALVVGHFKLYYFIEHRQIVISRLWDTRQDPTKFFVSK